MLYSSAVYLPFLLAALAAYWWLVPARARRHFLTAASLLLLAYLSWRATAALLVLATFVYVVGTRVAAHKGSPRVRSALLAAGIGVPLAYLATFKYLPAYAPPIEQLLGSMTAGGLLLPLGISYFTFKFLHYLIEMRRGTLPAHDFGDFLCFITLFTIFPAGPIERFGNLQPQFAAPRFDGELFRSGLGRIVSGLVKKVLVADFALAALLEQLGDVPGNMAERSSLALFAWIWLKFLTLYFDFAGYSDLAIGTSRLFGLRVIENFDWPLLKRNISEFWRSWHMSLTNWCRDYIYFPVFGLTRNPVLAILACMIAVGYWHGAHPKWLLWGAWHGVGLALWQAWQMRKRKWPALLRISRDSQVYALASWALTVNFVVMGGLITAFDRPLDALRYFLHMLTPS